MSTRSQYPAQTLEGWYALHEIFALDRTKWRAMPSLARMEWKEGATTALHELAKPEDGGWTLPVVLIGSTAELMLVHFRPTLDGLGAAQRRLTREAVSDVLRPAYSFLSITEAGLFGAAAKAVAEAAKRGGTPGDEEFERQMAMRAEAERASEHVQKRLYPERPADMPYVCFYPMSKRRAPGQNWYGLPIEERSRLMQEHGMTGRKYAGRILQIITGAIGFDAWEWGVTLFARDPLDFKKLLTEMRHDEVSAEYAEFGPFYVGRAASAKDWLAAL